MSEMLSYAERNEELPAPPLGASSPVTLETVATLIAEVEARPWQVGASLRPFMSKVLRQYALALAAQDPDVNRPPRRREGRHKPVIQRARALGVGGKMQVASEYEAAAAWKALRALGRVATTRRLENFEYVVERVT